MKQAAATLGSGNLRLAVMLPEGEDLNEWVAVNSTFERRHYSIKQIFLLFQFLLGQLQLGNFANDQYHWSTRSTEFVDMVT